MDLSAPPYTLSNLAKINVILGKNGSGKSLLLQALEAAAPGGTTGRKKYITPERGGTLTYQGHIEQNMLQAPTWMADTRRVNQFTEFRQQTVVQFRRLELAILRGAESKGEVSDFGHYMAQLNALLDNIELRRTDTTFDIHSKRDGERLDPKVISSGEAELVSLGIEVLMFGQEVESLKENLLFLDEPDVHLHPDLQSRLVRFLIEVVEERGFRVVLATHSTALLGELSEYQGAAIAFMRPGETELKLEAISDVHRRVLPVFGAHPLSSIFNEAPVLVVEGDDDERIWQQAVKTAEGELKLYPVACDGVSEISDYEREVQRIVEAVYEGGIAYSLRDGDGVEEGLNDLGSVVRLRLACRTAENLLLTDEVLGLAGVTWDELVERVNAWIQANESHPRYDQMVEFRGRGLDRREHSLKPLRMLMVGQLMASNKPWEVLVGQAIGRRLKSGSPATSAHSLDSYLGPKVVQCLL